MSSADAVLRRLQLLFHHGYLDRPRAQIAYYRHGSQPMVYGIGNKAARLLEHRFGVPRPKVDWTTKNRQADHIFLEHTLAVAQVLIAAELSCRRHHREFLKMRCG